jgi:5'-nucleotidase
LNFTGEPALQAHVDAGRIAPSTMVNVDTSAGPKKVGIIGATTDTLPFVSSPGAVTVNNVADAVNAQIDALKAAGANVIILSSHLQGLGNDQALVSLLRPGVDLIIAGGGDELLANVNNPSPLTTYNQNAPGSVTDTGFVPVSGYNNPNAAPNQPQYPILSTNQDTGGNRIPIVTSRDNYSYLGRITLNVAADGTVSVDPSSNPQRVASTTADETHGVAPDPTLQAQVVDPVAGFVSGLAQQIIGTTSVLLNRSDVRFRETNLGNLVADAFLTKAQQLAASFGADTPQISLVNGGGIRDFIDAGNISKLDTFDVSPFGNILAVVKDVTSSDFKLLLENAYSKVSDSAADGITPQGTDGRFAQISGFRVVYNLFGQPMVLNTDGTVVTPGNRILDVTLDDGTPVILQGVAVPGLTLDIATLGFLATGGDQYFDRDYLSQSYQTSYTLLGITDQNALQDYIVSFGGQNIGADPRYDLAQDGRVTPVPEPCSALLLAGGMLGLLARRRRAAN